MVEKGGVSALCLIFFLTLGQSVYSMQQSWTSQCQDALSIEIFAEILNSVHVHEVLRTMAP